MRNLKKVLTLVLTLAMLLSVMVVGAGAAFSDQDSIKNTEAVNTCNALNIINGENGSFYPTRNVTRAEMCKMICVALNGGREPALATGIGSTFTDTVGHWASPYIEYCVREGVVGGIGGGLFDPNGAVTGTQAAKMLLVAIGYDAARQGYVGSNAWELNINSDAAKKGLYDGLESIDASAPLNRDNAAQIIYNAVDAPMVEYVFSAQTVNGTLTMVPTLKDKTIFVDGGGERFCTILLDKYEVYSNYGQLVKIEGNKLSIVHDKNYDSQSTGDQVNFSKITTDYTDLLGQTVKVLYKKTADQVLGVAAVDGNKVYTVAASAVEQKGDKVKFDGTEYKLEELDNSANKNTPNKIAQITVDKNGTTLAAAKSISASNFAGLTGSFDTIAFVDNDNDGTLEYAVITKVATGKVTYTSDDEIIAGGTTYDRDDNKIASNVAKDEYVSVIYDPFAEQSVIDVIAKGTGKLSVNSDGECMFSGDSNWYKVGTTGLTASNAGTSYDYWAYNGVLVDKDNAKNDASIDNLVMVLNKSSATMKNQALIMFSDGKTKTVDVVSDDYASDDVNFASTYTITVGGSSKTVPALTPGTLYLANETSEGWTFADISVDRDNNKEIGDYTFADSGNLTGSKIATVGSTPISDDAVVFVFGGGDDTTDPSNPVAGLYSGKTLTGKELKSLDFGTSANSILQATNGYFTSKINGLTRASIVAVTLKAGSSTLPSGSVLGDNYGLIVGNLTKIDSKTISYTVWDGKENKDVTEKKADITNRAQFTVINYDEIKADGEITGVAVPAMVDVSSYLDGKLTIASVWSTDNNKLWYTNNASRNLNSDTVYMYYDSNTKTVKDIGKTSGSLARADKAVDGVLIPNVKFIADANDVKFVLIDVSNAVKDALAVSAWNIGATNVASSSDFGVTGGSATFSKTSGIRLGETITLTVTVPAGKTLAAGDLTLTYGLFAANGTNTIAVPATTAGTEAVTLDFAVVANTVSNSISVAKT